MGNHLCVCCFCVSCHPIIYLRRRFTPFGNVGAAARVTGEEGRQEFFFFLLRWLPALIFYQVKDSAVPFSPRPISRMQ